jgi:hypothetical protein
MDPMMQLDPIGFATVDKCGGRTVLKGKGVVFYEPIDLIRAR